MSRKGLFFSLSCFRAQRKRLFMRCFLVSTGIGVSFLPPSIFLVDFSDVLFSSAASAEKFAFFFSFAVVGSVRKGGVAFFAGVLLVVEWFKNFNFHYCSS